MNPPSGTLPPSFWESRQHLADIRQFAQARRVSPDAMLAGVLARVLTCTDPAVVLPELVGAPASLNSFIAIVARSGGGKGASQGAAAAWFQPSHGMLRYSETTIGSGEGIAAAFAKPGRSEEGEVTTEIHTDSVLADVPEVDTIFAIAGRSGSTLTSELRKAWDGASLGFRNRSAERSVIVPAHNYRLALTVGVQPERSGALLDEAAGGFPQRFVWFRATDPHAPVETPDAPESMQWEAPTVPARADGKRVMQVCDTATRLILDAAVSRLRDEGDALDGHALLARLKIAALLALLDGSPAVRDSDWELSGDVMTASSGVRSHCASALRDAARTSNLARAAARGEAEVETDVRIAEVAISKAKEKILAHVKDHPVSASTMRKRLSPKLREFFDESLDGLEASGVVEVREVEYRGNKGREISLAATQG